MQLSIIIVNYKVRPFLFQCLCSVQEAIKGLDAEVWVVDNCSGDDTLDFIQPFFPSFHLIQNDANVGFSKANNQAIRLSAGRYVLLLNPDTLVSHSAIQESVKWMEEHGRVGAVGVALHNASGRFAWESRRGVPTPLVSFCKMAGLSRLFPRHKVMGRYYMRYLDRTQPSNIEILSGAYMMLRREALDEVGLLDESFFMYGEDIDLSYRLLKAGWENVYLPYPIIHYKGESEHPSTVRYVNVFHQAMIVFYEKHFRERYLFSGILIRTAVYAKAALSLLTHGLAWLRKCCASRTPSGRYWCYADKDNYERIRREAHKRHHEVIFLSSQDVPSHYRKGDMCLYDTTSYCFDEIVHRMTLPQYNPHHLPLATYHPVLGILEA